MKGRISAVILTRSLMGNRNPVFFSLLPVVDFLVNKQYVSQTYLDVL